MLAPLTDEVEAAVAAHMWWSEVPAGAFVVHQGDTGDRLDVIGTGDPDVIGFRADGRELLLERLGPGDVIGELSIVAGAPRTSSVRAVPVAGLAVVARRDLLRVAGAVPELALALARASNVLARRVSTRLRDGAGTRVANRLVAELLFLATDAGAGDGSQRVRATQQGLASRRGVSRETVNKQLRHWARIGLVELGRGVVGIADH